MTSTRKLAAALALVFLIAGGGWAISIASSTPEFTTYCSAERSAADAAKANRDSLRQVWQDTDKQAAYAEYETAAARAKSASDEVMACWQRWNTAKGEFDAKGGLAGSLAFLAIPLLVFAFWTLIRGALSRASDAAATRRAELKAQAEVRKAERQAEAEVKRVEREAAAEHRRAEAAQRLADAQARAAAQPQPQFAGSTYPAAPQYTAPTSAPVYDYPENVSAANPAYAQQPEREQFSSPSHQAAQESGSVNLDDLLDGKLR